MAAIREGCRRGYYTLMQRDFSFAFRRREHDALIIGKDPAQLATFVFVHGAGGFKELINTYAAALEDRGISMLAFDQSGAGKDTDNMERSSLEQRTDESLCAIERYATKEPLVICGSSMGGEVAIRMLEKFEIKSLILFCPAIYDKRAYTVRFGGGFSDIIREPNSWRHAASLEMLEKFTGKLLIIIGELDAVIPQGVIDALDAHSSNVSQKEIYRIPGCPHRYHQWLSEHPEESEKVIQKVVEYSV